MLNKIWFGLIFIGIVYGFAKSAYRTAFPPPPAPAGPASAAPQEPSPDAAPPPAAPPVPLAEMGKALNAATLDAAETSVTICINLVGMTVLLLGLMHVAKDAGMIDMLARLLRPVMRWLFPDVPDGHPAQGAMLMNISANMLGLDNAATPLGLSAMRELQTLNPEPDTATDAQILFLAINTSSVVIIPFSIIAYRAAAGSVEPARPLIGMFLATTVSTGTAIVVTRWLARRSRKRVRLALAAEGQEGAQ